jgi:hypothetical protein
MEKRCLRCGKLGHFIRQCRSLPPGRIRTRDDLRKGAQTLVIKKKGELSSCESSDEEEQGKE